jgi:hypothetical protein
MRDWGCLFFGNRLPDSAAHLDTPAIAGYGTSHCWRAGYSMSDVLQCEQSERCNGRRVAQRIETTAPRNDAAHKKICPISPSRSTYIQKVTVYKTRIIITINQF